MRVGAPSYGAEAPLVLGCARRPGAQAPIEELRSMIASSGFAWDRVLEFAVDHDVAPLFGRGVDEVRLDLPVAIADALTDVERSTRFRNVQLSQLLIDLLRTLSEGGVDAVTFKGPALASMLYGNVGLRTSSDIDLLVLPGDLGTAAALLEEVGCVRRDDRAGERSIAMHDPELGVDIDLESDLGSSAYYACPVDRSLLDRAVDVDVAGRLAPSLLPEDLLQAIALRAACHMWRSWKPLCDVADLVRVTEDLDWDRVEDRARQIDHLRTVDVSLRLARDHLAAPIPEAVARRIDGDAIVVGTAKFVARANTGRATMSTARIHRIRLASRQRWGHRMQYAGRVVRRLGRADS